MTARKRFAQTMLNLIIVTSMLLTSCTLFGPSPTPAPTPAPASPTPFPPIAPVVVDYLPQPGEELPPDGVVSVFFDQPMNTQTVESAFAIEPRVPGSFEWADHNATVHFKPAALERQKKYSVTVGDAAMNQADQNLSVPFKFTFTTVGFLEVGQVLPAPDTPDAETSAAITVMFNRPIVPLVTVGDQSTLPTPIEIDPPASGKGEWLNTAIYIFRPDTALEAGRTYTVKVKAGLTDTTGGTLKEDYTWKFTTVPPSVLSSTFIDEKNFPYYDPTSDVGLSPVISVTFNQRMDHASSEAAFSLAGPDGRKVGGSFTWYFNPSQPTGPSGTGDKGHAQASPHKGGQPSDMPPHSETLGFRPEARLALGTNYTVKVDSSARALSGTAMQNAYSTSFRTVAAPAILSTTPANGDAAADPYTAFSIQFASPMDMSRVREHISIFPEPTGVYTSGWGTQFTIGWAVEPSKDYAVTITPGIPDVYGNTTSDALKVQFATRAYDPAAYLDVPGQVGTYNGYNDTVVYARYRNVSRLDLALYPVTLDEFSRVTIANDYTAWLDFRPSGAALRTWSENVSTALNATDYRKLSLAGASGGTLTPGLYYLTITAPELPKNGEQYWGYTQRHLLVVSKANITLKNALRESMVWVTDLKTGEPISGAPAKLYRYNADSRRAAALSEGSTDAQGVWQSEHEALSDIWTSMFATVEGGPVGFALSTTEWNSGVEPWNFNIDTQYYRQDGRGYVYTDRPIYRPGQTVYFKSILRLDDDTRYSMLKQKEVLAHVNDPEGREVYSGTLTLTPYGTAFGQFSLAAAATLGYYQVGIDVPPDVQGSGHTDAPALGGGQESAMSFYIGFQVAEYRKPEFQVKVTTDKTQYAQSDKIHVDAQATYFFGGPVADQQVFYTVNSDDYYLNWPGPGWYDFTDYDPSAGDYNPRSYYQSQIAQGTGRTDAQGGFSFDLPADLGSRVNSQSLSIEVSVVDITNQSVGERATAIVHKGDFYVGLAPQAYVGSVNQEQAVNILTVGWDAAPFGQQQLQAVFMKHDWNCALKEDESGSKQWKCDVIDTPVYTTTVTTNEAGKAAVSFTPTQGGVYRVQAKGQDKSGHSVSASTYLWITSGEYVTWRQNNTDKIDLVTGQKSYKPGDTAEILIPSPFKGVATALVTVERGRVLQHEVITLEGNSSVYRLPIKPEFAPNVFVSVVIVKGGSGGDPADFRLGLVGIDVSNEQKQITLTLTPDKAQLGPRDTVTYDVHATDFAGRPVQSELSVGLIDLSVLTLAADSSGPIMDSFWGRRALGVRTSTGLSVSVDRMNLKAEENKKSKGGGGGGGDAGLIAVRQKFPDTAFWKADLVTDADGRARFSVVLPDSLTTWRLDARAISVDTLAGQSTTDIVTSKPLLIRPVTPRFFVVGDVVTLAAVVNNNTTGAVSADVTLSASGVALAGQALQNVQVPAQGMLRVTWQATVQDAAAVDLTFKVSGGGMEDASKPPMGQPPEQLLPVYKYSTPETTGTAGVLTKNNPTRMEVIALPQRLDITQGELSVNVSPSLAASTLDGLKALDKTPYECLEQEVSRFLPNVVAYRALKKLGVSDPELEGRLPGLISRSLQRIYSEQHADGGWGWFSNYDSSAYLTAYVLFALANAEDAGFTVDANVKARAAEFLAGTLKAPQNVQTMAESNEQAWLLYVLARSGHGDTARTSAWYDARQKLSHFGRAYLALALHALDAADARPKTIVSDLVSAAVLTATGAHWEEQETDWWSMNTDTRSTAIALEALAQIDPQNELNPNVVRWLMVARKGDAWSTTQETAWSLMAFTDYMAVSGELKADYTWGVAINYRPIGTGQVNADTLRTTTRLTVNVADLLREAGNRLSLERQGEGEGNLYYTAHLNAYLPVENVKALSRGVSVGREYFRALTPAEQAQCVLSEGKDPVCTPKAITQAQVGDTIQVKLTLVVPTNLYYVYVEDPLPAGTEAIDTSLLTSSQANQGPLLTPDNWDFNWGYWFFGHTQMRDEKTVLFAESLPKGTYVYTYQVQATVPGEFRVMPTHAGEFYFPETWGRSDGSIFRIADK